MVRSVMGIAALLVALAGCSVSEHSSTQSSVRYRAQSVDGGKAVRLSCIASSSGTCRFIVQRVTDRAPVREAVAVGQSMRLPTPRTGLRTCADAGTGPACRPNAIGTGDDIWSAEGSSESSSVHEDVHLGH